jgi:hypothetical protein
MEEYVDETTNSFSFTEMVKFYSHKLSTLNRIKFPRILHEYSRKPFSLIKNPIKNKQNSFLKDFRKIFFKENNEGFSDVMESDFVTGLHVVPTKIKFEERDVVDQRIQLEFDPESTVHLMVSKMLNHYKIIDLANEYIEDVSLLIGGTVAQSVHGDMPRMYCYWKSGREVKQVHEVNRENYNVAVSDKYGMSSIIIDVSSDQSGFFLSIPKHTIVNQTTKTCMTPFSNDKLHFFEEGKGADDNDLVTIKIDTGCQFSSDFMHAGANNVQKLPSDKQKEFTNWLSDVSDKIQNRKGTIKSIFKDLSSKKVVDISITTRFFCKTFPKKIGVMKVKDNIYFPDPNVDEFEQLVQKIKEKVEKTTKSKKQKTKDLTPNTPPSSGRVLRDKSPKKQLQHLFYQQSPKHLKRVKRKNKTWKHQQR